MKEKPTQNISSVSQWQNKDVTIIGIDGGATKVSAYVIEKHNDNSFKLGNVHSLKSYREYSEYDSGFSPVNIQTQLAELNHNKIQTTQSELRQEQVYLNAFADVIGTIDTEIRAESYIIGIGMPGLKTPDKRGIAAMANGPRMPDFATKLERQLDQCGIRLFSPIIHLGSDADYCGIGEEYASNGLFCDVNNAYYLGGGTGVADALKLKNELIPFDKTKSWIAKTWEMKNNHAVSLENYASAGGIQTIYSRYSGITVEELNKSKMYPNRILELALKKDVNAIKTYRDVSKNLAHLIYERITTVYAGWQSHFDFVNPNRESLEKAHPYFGTLLDRIIIGQRLGDLLLQSKNTDILWKPFLSELTDLINRTDIFPKNAKLHYVSDNHFNTDIIQISKLREAPVLGAGVDSFLSLENTNSVGIELTPPVSTCRESTHSKEPIIKVGVVLPEDNLNSLQLTFPNPEKYFIEDHNDFTLSRTAKLTLENNRLKFGTLVDERFIIRHKTGKDDLSELVEVHPIVAGRGFHWQKHISAQYPGDLEIRVKDGAIFMVNHISAEHYLMCVATSEMSAECPPSLTESQTIVARSWLLAGTEKKHAEHGIDVCNDDCCQRYQGAGNLSKHSTKASKATSGQVLTYDNEICDARYSKSCGGMMETFVNVWGGDPHPYLQNRLDMPHQTDWDTLPLTNESHAEKWIQSTPSTFCSSKFVHETELKKYIGNVDESGTYYRWNLTYTQAELTNLLNEKLSLSAKTILDVKSLKRGGSSRLISIDICYLDDKNLEKHIIVDSEYEIRRILHAGFLYSSAIIIEKENYKSGIPSVFKIFGAGWGHGVGLCQIGALGMALNNHSTKTILQHYYPGAELHKLY